MEIRFTKDQIKIFKELDFTEVRPDDVDPEYRQYWKDMPVHPFLINVKIMVDPKYIELWATPHRYGSTLNPVLINLWKYKESELIKVLNLLL